MVFNGLHQNKVLEVVDVLAGDIIENLQSAMDSFNELMATLKK